MTSRLLVLLIFLYYLPVFAQTTSIVVDATTNEPVPYVNITSQNKRVGTTASETGSFTFPAAGPNDVIVFTAIGYKTLEKKLKDIGSTVALAPEVIQLRELVISPRDNADLSVGKFEKKDIVHYFGCGGLPWIIARLYPYKKEYGATPFLKKIKLFTKSTLKDAVINIRLYLPDENGEPGSSYYSENILMPVKKGEKISEIDISALNITFPEEGLFVAAEWLIIDRNFDKNMAANDIYQPGVGYIACPDCQTCAFAFGKWECKLNKGAIATELILTN